MIHRGWQPVLLLLVLFAGGCGEKPAVTLRKEAVGQIPCLRLRLLASHGRWREVLTARYSFESECPFALSVRHREAARCNSVHNLR